MAVFIVSNLMGFTALGIILVIMIGVGVAEVSGLIASLAHPTWDLSGLKRTVVGL